MYIIITIWDQWILVKEYDIRGYNNIIIFTNPFGEFRFIPNRFIKTIHKC